jgi:hypothetical protein
MGRPLNPRSTREDRDAFDRQVVRLVVKFHKNMQGFDVSDNKSAADPQLKRSLSGWQFNGRDHRMRISAGLAPVWR